MSVALKAGGNIVVYTGKAQTAAIAFASIMSYLTIVYYWNNVTNDYELVITSTTMVPYGCYWVEVTQDCTWTYGAEATAPTSVQLYSKPADTTSHDANIVPYCGPSQSVENALASIGDYFLGAMYFDNTQKIWVGVTHGYMMVPNTPYVMYVNQDCVWTFVAVEKVSFSVVGTGFPFATNYWMLYYYDPIVGWVTDDIWHGVNDEIPFTVNANGGWLGTYCVNYIGQVVDFKQSEYFTPKEGVKYEYDIASGKVSPFGLVPTFSQFAVTAFSKI